MGKFEKNLIVFKNPFFGKLEICTQYVENIIE